MTGAPRRPTAPGPARATGPDWSLWLSWGGCLGLAVFFLGYVTPRKGVIFSDEGWYLYAALRALRHGELDLFLPQAPSYLFNAGCMAIFGPEALPLRWVNSLACLAAGAVLLSALGNLRRSLPLGLSCILVAALSPILNYANGPSLFLLLGLGLHWLARRARSPLPELAGELGSGLCLACSAMVNLTVAPALALLCLWLLYAAWRDRNGREAVSPLSCGLFLAAMLGLYLHKLGWATMFSIPKGHGFHSDRMLAIVLDGLLWPVGLGVLWLAGRLTGSRPGLVARMLRAPTGRPALWGLGLLTVAAALPMVKYFLLMAAISPPFPLRLLPTIHPMLILAQYAYAVICLTLLGGDRNTSAHARALTATVALLLFWSQSAFYSDIPVRFSKLFLAGYLMAMAVAVLLPRAGRGGRCMVHLAVLFFVASCLGYVYYGGWTSESPLTVAKVALPYPGLKGIRETPARAKLFAELKQVYDANDCANKTLITFRNTSLLYYWLDHKAPPRLSYVSQNFGIYRDEIRAVLDNGRPWCVFYSSNMDLISNKEQERQVLDMIQARAQKRIDLGNHPPRHLYDDFVVYVGPKADGN